MLIALMSKRASLLLVIFYFECIFIPQGSVAEGTQAHINSTKTFVGAALSFSVFSKWVKVAVATSIFLHVKF
jgi:hypothetical protein